MVDLKRDEMESAELFVGYVSVRGRGDATISRRRDDAPMKLKREAIVLEDGEREKKYQ